VARGEFEIFVTEEEMTTGECVQPILIHSLFPTQLVPARIFTLMGQSTAFGGLFMNVYYVVFSCFVTRMTPLNERTGEPIESSEGGYGLDI
jgi:hypothetical protein